MVNSLLLSSASAQPRYLSNIKIRSELSSSVMELHQLRYLLAVVDEGSFSAAARAVRISQSGVSTQIQKLERELGLRLIDRSPRQVTLTAAGATLLPAIRSVLAAVAQVSVTAHDLRGLVVGSLRIGTVTGPAWPSLVDALAAVHDRHPGVDLRLHEGNSDDLIAGVRDGRLDVAVASWAGEPPAGLACRVVVDDALVVIVAPGHPWAARAAVDPGALAAVDLMTLPAGTGARTALDAVLTRVGASADPRWEVSAPATVRMLAARNLGVGVLSATTCEGWDDVVAVPIDDPQARSRFGPVWSTRPSRAARALLQEMGLNL